jgi:hypothetical protein
MHELHDMHRASWLRLAALLLSTVACQPVIAMGWNEFLFLFLLVAVLLGPPVYKFVRRIERKFRGREKDKTNSSE